MLSLLQKRVALNMESKKAFAIYWPTPEVLHMSKTDQSSPFLPEQSLDPDQLSVDRPIVSPSPEYDRIPSGYDPIGDIQLRGRAYRGLAGGSAPWWILFTGWFMFGGLVFLILIPIVTSAALELLPMLAFASLPLLIVIRGTRAKLRRSKDRYR